MTLVNRQHVRRVLRTRAPRVKDACACFHTYTHAYGMRHAAYGIRYAHILDIHKYDDAYTFSHLHAGTQMLKAPINDFPPPEAAELRDELKLMSSEGDEEELTEGDTEECRPAPDRPARRIHSSSISD